MGIKTEDFVKSLPPKEMTEGVNWLKVLDDFDPSTLEQKYLDECARRNPYETCYKEDPPFRPVAERLHFAEFCVGSYRRDLALAARRIEEEGLTPIAYKNARMELIRNIGIKGAAEVVRQEYERLGEEGRKRQAEAYAAWEKEQDEKKKRREKIYSIAKQDPYFLDNLDCYKLDKAELKELDEMLEEERRSYSVEAAGASVHEKIIRIRKGWKGSDGKYLTQRDFAKVIGYPINKYMEAEKIDRWEREPESPVENELLEKLVMIVHANPYWLFDRDCEEYMAEDDFDSNVVIYGDQPSTYAKPDVILKWIKEGKPKITFWIDGVIEKKYRW